MLLLVLVGTGTAGKYSNLSAGLARTIELSAPRRFWLLPSEAETSRIVADLVGEGARGQGWEEGEYPAEKAEWVIEDPDDLHVCRGAVGRALRWMEQYREEGEEVVINPTSGTKQMSSAALVAALEYGVQRVDFTVGPRADGVVVTGQEVLRHFPARVFLAERVLERAEAVLRAGQPGAALQVIAPFARELPGVTGILRCLAAWQAGHYERARQEAARLPGEDWRGLRQYLDGLARAEALSEARLADRLATAERLWAAGDVEAALWRFYQVVELSARVRVRAKTGLEDPFPGKKLMALPGLSPALRGQFHRMEKKGEVRLGLGILFELLEELNDPLGEAFQEDGRLQEVLNLRNSFVHNAEAAPVEAVQTLRDRTHALMQGCFPGLEAGSVSSLWPDSLRLG